MRYFKLLVAFVLLSYSLTCYGEAPQLQNNTALPGKGKPCGPTKILNVDNNGGEIRLAPGEIVEVELNAHGGTGYNWHVDELDEIHLKFIGKKTRATSPKNVAGGPVIGIWTFEAVAPGDTVLRLLYYRIWEGKGRAINKFEVKLHITNK